MMVFLPLDTWIRLIVWMIVGFDVYLYYGMNKSHLNKGVFTNRSYKTVSLTGLAMVVVLIIVAFLHHSLSEVPDMALFYFSLGFAALHAIIFLLSTSKGKKEV
jgi:APA family basic amino acid/polyamine antiporter